MRDRFFLLILFFLFSSKFLCRKLEKNKKKLFLKNKENGKKSLSLEKSVSLLSEDDLSDEVHIVIFIHGTVSGIHTYGLPSGPQQTLKGTYSYITEALGSVFKKGEQKYKKLYSDVVGFGVHKNRRNFFCSDKLPLIMGIYPGLREIPLDDADSVECTPTAYKTILNPFREAFEKAFEVKRELCRYYTFNWIGDLSLVDRKEAARVLQLNLRELTKEFSGKKTKFFVFAFSHGGNVFLEAISQEPIFIYYFCSLGMPIGRETINWLKNASIKKLFNFFSYSDKVQVADFLFNFPNFSKRKIAFTNDMKNIGNIYNISVSVLKNKEKFSFKHHYFYFNSLHFGIPLLCYIPLFLDYFINYDNSPPYSISLTIDPGLKLHFLSEIN
jgi:hypothetical protein